MISARACEADKSSDLARFMSKVRKTDACWLWTAGSHKSGRKSAERYGRFWLHGSMQCAHRSAYELLVGPIPDGLTIDHVKARGCTSTLCVNPAHLEVVTYAENNYRGNCVSGINKRKSACGRGHPLSGTNVRFEANGWRTCRTCERAMRRRVRDRGMTEIAGASS